MVLPFFVFVHLFLLKKLVVNKKSFVVGNSLFSCGVVVVLGFVVCEVKTPSHGGRVLVFQGEHQARRNNTQRKRHQRVFKTQYDMAQKKYVSIFRKFVA